MFRISGQRVMTIGDLHADDRFEGRHINYWENLIETVERIQKVVLDEKPDVVIIAGDLIGVRRGVSTLRDRNALLYVAQFLRSLPNCIVVKGNHDYSEVSDYEFLSALGVFKSTKQIGGVIEFSNPYADDPCYIHCVDYGQENEKIDIVEGVYNIGVMHNEFYAKGKELQYHGDSAIELTSKGNFFGLDIIFTGHIHTPSTVDFTFQNGFESALVNLGCPTRPSHGELYNEVYYTILEYEPDEDSNKWTMGFRQEILELKPYEEIFRPDEDYLEDEDSDKDDFTGLQKSKLEDILSTMTTTNMGSEDFLKQIDSLTIVSPEAKEIAKNYLKRAMNE